MTTSTFYSILRSIPVALGLFAAICPVDILAQHQSPLPVTSSQQITSQLRKQAVAIHRQAITGGHIALTKAAGTPSLPLFTQRVTGTDKPLVFGEVSAVQEKKIIQPQSVAHSGTALSVTALAKTVKKLTALTPDGPVGTPDKYAVPSDKTLSIAAPGFLANDIDLNGEAITATSITDNVDNGTLSAFADGSFTYTPHAGFTGIDSFAYTMKDASNNPGGPVTVTIEVLPPANRTPVGSPDVYTALSGTTLSIASPGFLANDIDPDGEAITATSITDNVDHGTLAAFANGSFTYTPTAGFTGIDSFSYTMKDASNHSSGSITVTINVVEGNRPPIGIDDQYIAVINRPLSIAAPGFLANDVDPDGDAITATSITDNVDHGTLSAFANGSFTYTPNAGFKGIDSFSYTMRDAANHASNPITVIINVSTPGNGPVGTPDKYAVPSDKTLSIAAPGFLANDIDLNGEALTATSITDNVDNGTLSAFANGSFTYTPHAGFTGIDSFAYTMKDASNNSSGPVTVTIEVLPAANRTPVGSPDVYTALSGTTLSIASPGFLANDIDPDGETITATSITDNVDHGTLAAFANGSFSYTPTAGFTGIDSFSYTMKDASNHSSGSITVTMNVVEGNRPPIGVDDEYTAVINKTLSIAAPGFLANDIDPDGDAITATSITHNVNHGTLSAFANGSFTYTPTADFTGIDTFVYRMRDAFNNPFDSTTVIINVVSPNRPPVADAGPDKRVECDGSGGATVMLDGSGSSDPDNDALTYTWRENGNIIAGPTTESQTQQFLTLGLHTIELTVEDGFGESATDNVVITVTDLTPPIVTAAFISQPRDHNFTISCSASDACDQSLTSSSVITLPTLNNPEMQFLVKQSEKIMINLKTNKILVQAPDPQLFWDKILAVGGVPVINGQWLSLGYNKETYSFIFDNDGNLTSVEGPIIVLRCTATDASGNTAVAEATAPIADHKHGNTMRLDITDNTDAAGYLGQNYPNPFKYTTVIGFTLKEAGVVRLGVYDSKGQLVKTLVDAVMAKGQHQVTWNANNLSAGIYYYRIYTGSFVQIRKMVLLR